MVTCSSSSHEALSNKARGFRLGMVWVELHPGAGPKQLNNSVTSAGSVALATVGGQNTLHDARPSHLT